MKQKRALITGGNSGIGFETALSLAREGAEIIIACRNQQKADAACETLRSQSSNPRVSSMPLNLASLKSTRQFAENFRTRYASLDVLINNAGVFPLKRQETQDGFELNMGVNHLGHFLLTLQLLPVIEATPQARIVIVASDAHLKAKFNFDDVNCQSGYQWLTAYANSKLANVAFALALARKLEKTGVTVNCLHPGMSKTNIWPRETMGMRLFSGMIGLFAIPAAKAAQNVARLASSTELAGVSGKYFDQQKLKSPSAQAADTGFQEKLWAWSAKAVQA